MEPELRGRPLGGAEVLVTGGSGFIGTYLCQLLSEESAKVFNLDSREPAFKGSAVHINKPGIDSENLRSLVRSKSAIFHLASRTNAKTSVSKPFKDSLFDIDRTLEVLESIRKYNDSTRLLLASTSAVYGETKPRLKSESDQINPVNPYAASKAASEIYASMYRRKYGLKIVIVRPFNTYGAFRTHGKDVVTQFVNAVKSGNCPRVSGTGGQIRDFTYVKDTVRMMSLAVKSDAAQGKILNIGTGRGVKILELARLVIEVFRPGSGLKPIIDSSADSGAPGNICDNSLLRRTIGTVPETTIEEGLTTMKEMILSAPGLQTKA